MLTCITVQKLKIEQDYQQTKEHTEVNKQQSDKQLITTTIIYYSRF